MNKIFRIVVPALVLGVSGAPGYSAQPKKVVAISQAVAPVAASETPDKPGLYKRLPCRKNPELTYDIRLPKSYADDKEARFPALIISSAGGNPGCRGLEKWADDSGVILVGINDSKNGDWAPVFAAQEAVLDAITAYRIHPALRFATGQSGAAWASVLLAKRHPKEIAGVVLQIHSGNGDLPPKGCSVAFIGGLRDTVHPDAIVRAAAEKCEKSGYYVQQAHLDMAHEWAPPAVVAGMLDNMIFYSRMTSSALTSAERSAAAKLPDEILAKASAEKDPGKACAMLAPLVDIEEFRNKSFRPKALSLWCETRAKALAAMPDTKAAFVAYADETTYRRFNESSGASLPGVKALLQKFSADTALKSETPALTEFARMRDSYQKEAGRGAKVLKEWAVKFGKFIKKNEGTVAADLAKKIAPKG